MSYPQLNFLVTRSNEGGYVPTYGHIATSCDIYRTVALHTVENRPEAWCFTDTASAGALGRLIDGPILGKVDIENAESAIRAVLLHDFVDVLVPCTKTIHENGYIGYTRFDQHQRNDAAFAGMNVAPCRDLLAAFEMVRVKNGEIIESTYRESRLVGSAIESNEENYQKLISVCADFANAFPMQLGAAAYFAMKDFNAKIAGGSAGFIDSLYARIYKPWIEVVQSEPTLFLDVKLPPFVSIVLSRAPNRGRIPETLSELREELGEARQDLVRLNAMLDGTASQADIHSQVRRVNESFDAIVPEALLTDVERRWRRIASVFSFVRPVRQIYSVAVDPLSADPEKLAQVFQSTTNAVLKNERIVSRSVSAAKFAELLRVESVRGMLTSHFDEGELRRLQQG